MKIGVTDPEVKKVEKETKHEKAPEIEVETENVIVIEADTKVVLSAEIEVGTLEIIEVGAERGHTKIEVRIAARTDVEIKKDTETGIDHRNSWMMMCFNICTFNHH